MSQANHRGRASPASVCERELDSFIHRWFERQAAQSPHATAATHRGSSLTYAALNRRANLIAHRLAEVGVGPETLVGLYCGRGFDLLAGVLAILKTGGAYVPMDPAYPSDRLAVMIEDAQPAAVLRQSALGGRLPAACDAPALSIEEILADSGSRNAPNPQPSLDPCNLAYTLFTSGSTGRPKGVCVSHDALANFMASMRREPGLGAGDRLLAVTSISFDIAALELFLPLVAGGVTVIVDRDDAIDGARLAALLRASRADLMQATPVTWRILLDAGWRPVEPFKALCGGEAMPPKLAQRLAGGRARVWNLYGPTETTIWSTLGPVDGGEVDIGKPIRQTVVRIMDRFMKTTPPGVAGRLLIGGSGLARGYQGRPDLTAERFSPDPQAETPGARLYHTGDRAVSGPGGVLRYLGRVDRQVKTRGHRVELGEVEAALERLPKVSRAVVVARRAADTAALHGFVSLASVDLETASGEDCRDVLLGQLAQALPAYMVPQSLQIVTTFPLTPNGKIDRKALAAAEPAQAPATPAGDAPSSPTEAVLRDIWIELLRTGEVGSGDRFLNLGGHSLSANLLAMRVRDLLGVSLPPHAALANPSLREMSAMIDQQARAEPILPEPGPRPGDAPAPLSLSQERIFGYWRGDPDNPYLNFSASLDMRGSLDASSLQKALAAVADRHRVLRLNFAEQPGGGVELRLNPSSIPTPVVDLRALSPARRKAAVSYLAGRLQDTPFDLRRGPLFRALLSRRGARRWTLALTFHHIAADGWSTAVFCRELAAFYRGFRSGREAPLPPPQLQYADFAHWQRVQLGQPAMRAQLTFWRRALRAPWSETAVPADKPPTPRSDWTAGLVEMALEPVLANALRGFCRNHGLSEFPVLAAGFALTLHGFTGQEDLSLGFALAYRNFASLADVIGLFAKLRPLRLDLGGSPTFDALAHRANRALAGVYAHQDIPIDHILTGVAGLDLGDRPLFNVVLNWRSLPRDPLRFGSGLRGELAEMPETVAKWPLLLHMVQTENDLTFKLVYQRARFSAARARAILEAFSTRLGGSLV